LNADERVLQAARSGELGALVPIGAPAPEPRVSGSSRSVDDAVTSLPDKVVEARWRLAPDFLDHLTAALYAEAERITRATQVTGLRRMRVDLDRRLDRLLTSRWTGFPLMMLLLAVVFWITIAGANVPSAMLAMLLIDTVHPVLREFGATMGMPWWRAEGRGYYLFAGAPPVPAATDSPDPVHLAHRPHGDCAVARRGVRAAGWGGHLADLPTFI
jgi:ferrous iron transport protein B